MADAVWQVDAVTLGGRGHTRLRGVTVAIRAGVTAVLGPSGAGKTSMLNLLVGFEKPDAGRVVFNAAAAMGDGGFRGAGTAVFWSPQDAGLWPHLTLREHLEAVTPKPGHSDAPDPQSPSVAQTIRGIGMPRLGGQQRVDELLDAFDLADRAHARPEELSQGERSRLSVARCLAAGPAAMVMDEPLAHVDPARVGKYWAAIRDDVQRRGATLVFSTHRPDAVLAEAGDVIVVHDGAVLYHGDVQTLYWRPANEKLARALGDVNWLERDEVEAWLGHIPPGMQEEQERPHAAGFGVRPEQVQIVNDDASAMVVRSTRFLGSVAEAELSHEHAGLSRTFVHRPAGDRLKPGDRVSIRLLTLLLAFLLLSLPGCGDEADAPLPAKQTRYHPMPPAGAAIPAPRTITVGPDGQMIVLDNAGRVLVYNDRGEVVDEWWMPEYDIGKAEGAAFLQDGRIVVADTHYHRLVFFDREGNVLSYYGEKGDGDGQFHWPIDVIQDPQGFIYVAEYGGNDRIQKFTPDFKHVLTIGSFGDEAAAFQRPSGMAWHEGRLYVADAINNRVKVFTDEGKFVGMLPPDSGHAGQGEAKRAGNPAVELKFPYDLSIGPDGLLYIIEYQAGRLTVMERTGRVTGRYGRSGRGDGELSTPWGVDVDAQGRVWIADTNNRRIVELHL